MKCASSSIQIHWSFWLFALVCFFYGGFLEFFCLVLALIIHEAGHFVAALKRGYKTLRLVLTPLGGQITGIDDQTMQPDDQLVIAISGPFANIIAAVFFSAFLWWFPELYWFLQTAIIANLLQCFFNLLPIYPLDGGRVLLGIIKKKHTVVFISKAFSLLLLPICFLGFHALITCMFLFIAVNWQGSGEFYANKLYVKKSGARVQEIYINSN
ncbi:MAG: site-2 protease family protein, partial [Firmicutes bacterium]|nr:site-2 protease family protein [Bacillota bacterium]